LDFEWPSKAYIYVWLGTKLKREFCLAKMSYPLKRQRERFQKNFIVKCSLKRNPWPNTCKIYKDSYMIFIVIFFSWRENFFFHSFYSMRLVKRLWVSCCKGFLNTRDGLSLYGSDFVMDFTKIVEISSGLLFSFPLSHLCYCNQFFFYILSLSLLKLLSPQGPIKNRWVTKSIDVIRIEKKWILLYAFLIFIFLCNQTKRK